MSITSVKFAGASMEFVANMRTIIPDDDGDVMFRGVFGKADVYMYRNEIRAVSVGSSDVNVYDTQGNKFIVDVGCDDPNEVAVAIGEWRMAASQRWEDENRARSSPRRSKPKAKPTVKNEVDDDG